ncbi:MAG: nitroreductase family protein [Candidatus Edwardsbacteria bacterium]
MDIYEAIRTRRSVRAYKPDPIPEDKLRRILEAMRLAPSAKNIQPWKFIVVRNQELIKKLVPACNNQAFVGEAPVVIVGCALEKIAYGRMGGYMSSFAIDLAIVFEHLMLAAVAEGLGTCWIGSFKEKEVKQLLNVPEDVRVVALTPLGYPAVIPEPRPRKPLSEIVSYEKF